jgi:hypothetical protein
MISTGLAVAGLAPLMMSRFSIETGGMQLLWPQVIQGAGFTFIFVALSTTALSGVEKRRLTGASGLYNLIRQLGGSFGTAIFAAMLTSQQQANRAVLIQHLSPYNPEFTRRLNAIEQGFISRGINAWNAHLKALKLLEGLGLVSVRQGDGATVRPLVDASLDILGPMIFRGGRIDLAIVADMAEVMRPLLLELGRLALGRLSLEGSLPPARPPFLDVAGHRGHTQRMLRRANLKPRRLSSSTYARRTSRGSPSGGRTPREAIVPSRMKSAYTAAGTDVP